MQVRFAHFSTLYPQAVSALNAERAAEVERYDTGTRVLIVESSVNS